MNIIIKYNIKMNNYDISLDLNDLSFMDLDNSDDADIEQVCQIEYFISKPDSLNKTDSGVIYQVDYNPRTNKLILIYPDDTVDYIADRTIRDLITYYLGADKIEELTLEHQSVIDKHASEVRLALFNVYR